MEKIVDILLRKKRRETKNQNRIIIIKKLSICLKYNAEIKIINTI